MTTIVAQKWYPPSQPGWSGRFKAADGNYYGCKEDMMTAVPIGTPVEVEITIKEKDGKTYRDIKRVLGEQNVSATPPASARVNGNGRGGVETDAVAERIFVAGALNAYIRTGHFAEKATTGGFTETVRKAVQSLRAVFKEEMGPVQ